MAAPNVNQFAVDVITRLGGQPTQSGVNLFLAQQRKEGGWTNNAAAFNPLNRTDQGFPTMNKVGVAVYPDYQTGVARTVALLKTGYPALAKAYQSGKVNFQDPALQGDFNRWVSGKREPGASPYVQSIASLYGSPVPAGTPSAGAGTPMASSSGQPQPSAAPAPKPFDATPAIGNWLQQSRQGLGGSLKPLFAAISAMNRQQTAPGTPPSASNPMPTPGGGAAPQAGPMLQPGTSWKGSHVTDGLGWGTKSAEDIMASPGTGVGAPESGTIKYFHPNGAQGGGSMMLVGDSGAVYWLGHVADGLGAGSRVEAGQRIAAVSSDHARPHLHIDKRFPSNRR